MQLEAHAGLGWAIGLLAPGSDRRLRAWCVVAGVLPDVDAVSYLFGPEAYMNYHHTFGHNVFLGALLSAAAGLHHHPPRGARRALYAAALTALSFALHLVTDMRLSAYPVHLFWPFSRQGWELATNWGLVHPLNTALIYVSIALAALLTPLRWTSPLDLISPRLDRIVLSRLWRRPLRCATCERATNLPCDACGLAVCMRHGRVDLRFRITCPACVK